MGRVRAKRAAMAHACKSLWIAGAILSLCGVARAQDVRTRVEAWLSAGIEPAGVHEQVRALGSAGEDALWALYGDASKSRVVRLRALGELAMFATPRTAQGFARLVREVPTTRDRLSRSPLVLRRALDGLRTIAAQQPLPLTTGELMPALRHPDAHVRKAAATLLAHLDQGDVDGALGALIAHDPSRMVRTYALRAQATRATRPR
jgi:hypothetical protein